MLIPPKDIKMFFAINPYVSIEKLDKEKHIQVVNAILDLDKALNEYFGTKPYSLPKPKERVKKEKVKKEKKRSCKKEKSLSKGLKKRIADRKRKKKLREMISDIKKKYEDQL
jgi:hypothetical protein